MILSFASAKNNFNFVTTKAIMYFLKSYYCRISNAEHFNNIFISNLQLNPTNANSMYK